VLKGKHIILGVSGSISVYKACEVASLLVKQHADVRVALTDAAARFVAPVTFEALVKTHCLTSETPEAEVEQAASRADAIVVAPATANTIAEMACGLGKSPVSRAVLASTCPVVVAPAMNVHMFENEATQDNLDTLAGTRWYDAAQAEMCGAADGGFAGRFAIVPPAAGRLACGDVGMGKLATPEGIREWLLRAIAFDHDLEGKRILVTAGATQEAIDPVRYITNHSTGKMGYAVARRAMLRGAQVTLVAGQTALSDPLFCETVHFTSAQDLFDIVSARAAEQDAVVKAAAVADFRPTTVADEKIKKHGREGTSLELERTPDTLAWLGAHRRPGQRLCGFSMETCNVLENSRAKLERKNVDMIVANCLREAGAGFGTDTNHLTMITRDDVVDLPMMSKEQAAGELLTALFATEPREA
jgi:phosphopantothenoylcysteine decarboxylase/phosphopantothenate--cysteine ligase